MRQAQIFYKNTLSGLLTENDDGYEFAYLDSYLALPHAKPKLLQD